MNGWMVTIGHRSSKNTFGANNYVSKLIIYDENDADGVDDSEESVLHLKLNNLRVLIADQRKRCSWTTLLVSFVVVVRHFFLNFFRIFIFIPFHLSADGPPSSSSLSSSLDIIYESIFSFLILTF